MSELRKNNPYFSLICTAVFSSLFTWYVGICADTVRKGNAEDVALYTVLTCLLLGATIFHARIVWLELRKSDPHYQRP